MNILSLSTIWRSLLPHKNAQEFVLKIKELGFEYIELNFTITKEEVEEITHLQEKGIIKVSSLHNYCPMPSIPGLEEVTPDYFSLSSLDEEERAKAISLTKLTIDNAKRLSARAVVLHTGKVEMEHTSRFLVKWYSRGLKDTDVFQKYKKEMVEERALKSEPFFKKMLESLKVLAEYAQKNNIILGVENRFYYQEIPSFEELAIVLDEFKNSHVFYWHDVGHAYILENLGLGAYHSHLEKYGQRIGGVHLHDVVGVEDHQAPLRGGVDFRQLVPYLKPDTIKVMELHPPATEDEIRKAKKYLEELFINGS